MKAVEDISKIEFKECLIKNNPSKQECLNFINKLFKWKIDNFIVEFDFDSPLKVEKKSGYILILKNPKITSTNYLHIIEDKVYFEINGTITYEEVYSKDDRDSYSSKFEMKICIDLIEIPQYGLLNSTVSFIDLEFN